MDEPHAPQTCASASSATLAYIFEGFSTLLNHYTKTAATCQDFFSIFTKLFCTKRKQNVRGGENATLPRIFSVNYIRRNSLLRFLPSFILPEISKGEIYDDCRYCADAHERGKNYCEQLRHSQFNFFLLSLLSHFISLLFSFVSMIYPYQASEPPLREF